MPYANDDWWTQYAAYAEETLEAHVRIAGTALGLVDLEPWSYSLLDLGCGRTMTAATIFGPKSYVGVDLDVEPSHPAPGIRVVRGDYDRLDLSPDLLGLPEGPRLAASLFSAELNPAVHANRLYERLLGQGYDVLISAGFYYRGREGELLVEEPGGLRSRQTLPLLPLHPHVKELRLIVPVPSTLFGPDVVEVWRVLTK